MATFLWSDIVFGPIISRRVGSSLGINISPSAGKVCSFDCIYCECGLNPKGEQAKSLRLPDFATVGTAMRTRFAALHEDGTAVDSISFTGNGEPSLHPDFEGIIDLTLELRGKYFPAAVVSVFSNATQLHKASVRRALAKVDNPILKLDTLDDALFAALNRPASGITPERIVEQLRSLDFGYVLQTMFLKGSIEGMDFDNSCEALAAQWQKTVLELRPREVMIYTIDRETPVSGLKKVSVERMRQIAEPLETSGIKVQVNG